MKLLVTGGAGFIGSAVVRLAVAQGHSVVNLDALTYAACLENVANVADSPLYAFEQADICDRAALDRVFADHQPDAVMHLAAESHVDRSIDGPGAFIQTNITIGGVSILILVAVALETMRQIESRALMVTYDDYSTPDFVYGPTTEGEAATAQSRLRFLPKRSKSSKKSKKADKK